MHERVAFIHSYLSDTDKGGNPIPDRPTRACMLAAAELKRQNQVDTIALSVVPELSIPITKRLKMLLPKYLDNKDLISTEVTETTKGEVKEIKRLSEEKSWGEVVSVVISPHKNRVEQNVRRMLGNNQETVRVKTYAEVLKGVRQDHLYDGIISESVSWAEVRKFGKLEAIIQRSSKIPFIGGYLAYDLPDLLPYKIRLQKWLLSHFRS